MRVGTHPQRAVRGRGSFMISSPKRYIKLPQTLLLFSQPLFASFPCSLSFFMSVLQLSSHCVFSAVSAILPFSSPQCSPSLSSLSHLWIYATFALIASWPSLILSPFAIFFSCSRPVSKVFYLVHSLPLFLFIFAFFAVRCPSFFSFSPPLSFC